MQLRERTQLLFHVLDGRHRGIRVFARFARRFADARVVLLDGRRRRANLIEFGLERSRVSERRLDFFLSGAQLTAQVLERRALLLQCVENRLGLERLRRQVLNGLTVLVQLAVRPDGFLRGQLRLLGRVLQILNALVDLLQLVRPAVERGQAFADVLQPVGHRRGAFGDLFELLAERRQLGAPGRQRAEHGAEGASLLARVGNQKLEFFGLFLGIFALGGTGYRPERVEHGILQMVQKYSPSVSAHPIRICNASVEDSS